MKKTAVEYLVYDNEEWCSVSLEEMAVRNDPDALIIPVYEDGTQGQQMTWREWSNRFARSVRVSYKAAGIMPPQRPTPRSFQESKTKEQEPDSTNSTPHQIKISQPRSAFESKEFKELIVIATSYIKLLYWLSIIALAVAGFCLLLSLTGL